MDTAAPTKPKSEKPRVLVPRIVVVDDEPDVCQLVRDALASAGYDVRAVASLRAARRLLRDLGKQNKRVDVLLADVALADGRGLDLLPILHRHHPDAETLLISGTVTVDEAVQAVRAGAGDLLPKPFGAAELAERVGAAVERTRGRAKTRHRLGRLSRVLHKHRRHRKLVNQKVDLLCNDLIGAYGELARQVELVRTQEHLRKLLNDSTDLEQMLCHAMDWLLRHMGYSNLAVFLATDEDDGQQDVFELGAYMKYTLPGEKALVDALRDAMVPLAVRDGTCHLTAEGAGDVLCEAELDLLPGQTLLAQSCSYLGEPVAVVVMFRDGKCPFTPDDEQILQSVAPIFATCLAALVKRETLEEYDDDDLLPDEPDARKDNDTDEWWKRGDRAPF